jgi:hypothetical protein
MNLGLHHALFTDGISVDTLYWDTNHAGWSPRCICDDSLYDVTVTTLRVTGKSGRINVERLVGIVDLEQDGNKPGTSSIFIFAPFEERAELVLRRLSNRSFGFYPERQHFPTTNDTRASVAFFF